jgi:hypothetical protein
MPDMIVFNHHLEVSTSRISWFLTNEIPRGRSIADALAFFQWNLVHLKTHYLRS